MALFRRQKYLVSNKFQLKFVGWTLLAVFATAIIASFTIYYYMWMLLGEKLANVYPQGRLAVMLKTVNIALLVRLVIISPFIAMFAVVLSHRIAGPIYRIKKDLETVVQGNYNVRIRLRKTDELQDVADSINKVLDILDKQMAGTPRTAPAMIPAKIDVPKADTEKGPAQSKE